MRNRFLPFKSVGLVIAALAALSTLLSACSSSPATSTAPAVIQPSSAASQPSATAPGAPASPPAGSFRGQGVLGTVASTSGDSLTLTTLQGQKVKVSLSSTTVIDKTVTAALSDLQKGELLTIAGSPDASGVIAATSIISRPQMRSLAVPTPSTGAEFTPGTGQPGPGGNPGAPGQPGNQNGNSGGRNQPGGPGGNPADNSNGMFSRTIGTLDSVNGDTLVVNLMQGGQVTASVTAQTVIERTVAGAAADLAAGEFITVIGPEADNGDVTADSISIRPSGESPSSVSITPDR